MQDPKIAKNSQSGYHCTTLSGYIFAAKAYIDNLKKLLNSNISSTCPHNMVNFGPLTSEIRSGVWGTPANINGFRVLAALLHGTTKLCGVQQRVPPIFGRATITLRIGPYSSLLYFTRVVDVAKCIVVPRVCLSICLSLTAFPYYCMDPDVTWGCRM